MGSRYIQSVVIVVILCVITEISCKVEFTNIKCTFHDLELIIFEKCFLKSVNRTYKYASVKSRMLRLPISNATVNLSLLKRLNGYKPFLYNVSVDICKFLKTRKLNPVVKYLLDLFISHSNINGTCPYNPYVILEKLSTSYLNNQMTKVLPFPEGNYVVETKWITDNIHRCSVNLYLSIFS